MKRPLRASKHCRHYSYERGLNGGPRCAQGIDLSGPGAIAPCMPPDTTGTCAKREEYTEEEHAAWKAWLDDSDRRLVAAIDALPGPIPIRSGGHCECPNCKSGHLHWTRASNGHVWLQCTTADCLGPIHFNIRRETVWPASKAAST